MPTTTTGPIVARALDLRWHGMVRTAQAPICKVRLRLPRIGAREVLQDGYRLVLLPKLAFFALWDGTGETFIVPRAKASISEPALAAAPQTMRRWLSQR